MAAAFQGFRSLVENSPDPITVVDVRGDILYGSASTTKSFGYQPTELLGRNYFDLIHPDDHDCTRQGLTQARGKSHRPLPWDARFRHKNGRYTWVECTVSSLALESDSEAVVVHQRDIDLRRQAEEERQRQSEELIRSNLRLEEFAYTAAHDLREPLRAISLYSEILIRETQTSLHTREVANIIIVGAARMSALIDDLLMFASTGKQVPPRPVDLNIAVAQAEQNLALVLQTSGAAVRVDSLPHVPGNQIHLVRLFQNLIHNAVKYRSEEPIEIHITSERQGSGWIVRVRDNGIGIAAEYHDSVFMPFIRLASRDLPGTGLGLAVCKKIVEGFGGTIGVESEPGVGSTFSFTIPALHE
ncbi:MAG: ATP-binding protein [Acidobacteriota bacterium]